MSNIWIPPVEDRELLIYYCIRTFSLQPQEAEDVIQEAMIKYWEYYVKGNGLITNNPQALFYGVLKNTILNELRRKAFNKALIENLRVLEDFIVQPDTINFQKVERTVENYINSLVGDTKVVIDLYTMGKSQKQIFELTKIRPNRIKNILRKDRELGRFLKQIKSETH